MAYCTTCGTENSDTSSFCANCGSKIENTGGQPTNKAQDIPVYPEPSQYEQSPPYQQSPQYPPTQQYPPQGYGYQATAFGVRPPRTGWLTFVIVIN
jgi:hypothetical protein